MQKQKRIYGPALEIEIFGFIATRPKEPHPRPAHWERLKELARADTIARRGSFCCNNCGISAEDYPFELHHLHYSTWGYETLADVTYLCKECHEMTHVVISRRKYAYGWRDPETMAGIKERPVQDKFNMNIVQSTLTSEGSEVTTRTNVNEKIDRTLMESNPENLGNHYIKTR